MFAFWEGLGLPAGDLTRRLLRHTDLKSTDRYIQEWTASTLAFGPSTRRNVAVAAAAAGRLFPRWQERFARKLCAARAVEELPVAGVDSDDSDN